MTTYFIVRRREGSIQMLYLENDIAAVTWCKEQYGPKWAIRYSIYAGKPVFKGE